MKPEQQARTQKLESTEQKTGTLAREAANLRAKVANLEAIRSAKDTIGVARGSTTVPTDQHKAAISMPLLSYANTFTFYFWHHQHTHRALRLVEEIRRADSFSVIEMLIVDELRYYPGHQPRQIPSSSDDWAFGNTTNKYNKNEDSGYYKALRNAMYNLQPMLNPTNEMVVMKTTYK